MKTTINMFALIAIAILSLTSCTTTGQTINGVPLKTVTVGYVPETAFTDASLSNGNKLWDAFGHPSIQVPLDYNGDGVTDSYVDGNGGNAFVAMDYNVSSALHNSANSFTWVTIAGKRWVKVTLIGYSSMKYFNYNPTKNTPTAGQQSAIQQFAVEARLNP
jgi:hypothetical protein